jgi:acetyl-CoA synthetase
MKNTKTWKPNFNQIKQTNIYKNMLDLGFTDYQDFWEWSVKDKVGFWSKTIKNLAIPFDQIPSKILDLKEGVTQANWLAGAKMNIVNAVFNNTPDTTAIIYQKEGENIKEISYGELEKLVNRIANSLQKQGLKKGDVIAIDMPMTLEAVAIYLAGIKSGMPVATIADSFTPNEIAVRLEITQPKLVFTQDVQLRAGKTLVLYQKLVKAKALKMIVIPVNKERIPLRNEDMYWDDFLVENTLFKSVSCDPNETTTILFSSGTTGAPKAIPWTHTTPIKSASDGYYHQDIKKGDIVAWPTNLGWMMGPWLVFASLINKATMALYYGAPTDKDFGAFVQNAKINMLGLVPSIVRHWKNTQSMETYDWSAIKCFSSTGEASNPIEYEYLMSLANHKPIIEYCGGTEIGGGYVTATLLQENIPGTFSTQALGGEFVLLDENNQESDLGEVFIIPAIMGLSNRLLNRDHDEVYYKDTPKSAKNYVLRRHGDQIERLANGYYKMQGRVDDAMNLGGIKVSSLQIESVVNSLEFIKESAAIAITPTGGGPDKLVIYYVKNLEISKEEAFKTIKNLVKTRINPLFKVSDVLLIEQLPRTASGKVMRKNLRKEYNA